MLWKLADVGVGLGVGDGVGVGGHCIPCDPHYLVAGLEEHEAPIISATMTLIHGRPSAIANRAVEMLTDHGMAVHGARIVVAGVAYKPGIRDTRESPALEILDLLHAWGARVSYVDALVPNVILSDGTRLESVERLDELRSDLVIVATLHPRSPTGWIRRQPMVLDPGEQLDRFG